MVTYRVGTAWRLLIQISLVQAKRHVLVQMIILDSNLRDGTDNGSLYHEDCVFRCISVSIRKFKITEMKLRNKPRTKPLSCSTAPSMKAFVSVISIIYML